MIEKSDLKIELALKNAELLKKAVLLAKANRKLAFQNKEREQRAAELLLANEELMFQNQEKENRAAELIIANSELVIQNNEKEKRASELITANIELAYQNQEKEKKAAELIIANIELAYQNKEKESRAAELIEINQNLAFQIEENKKQTVELLHANKELETFTFISSHDLQEPLRKIQTFAGRILSDEYQDLSQDSKKYFSRIQIAASHMQNLINDLLAYSRTSGKKGTSATESFSKIVKEVATVFEEEISETGTTIQLEGIDKVYIIPFQFRQLLINLMGNSLKFAKDATNLKIFLSCNIISSSHSIDFLKSGVEYQHFIFGDNGIGFDPQYNLRIFNIFEQLDNKSRAGGTGMGLTIVKKIVENHNGYITAAGQQGVGTTFNIYIPNLEVQ